MNMSLSTLWELVMDGDAWRAAAHMVAKGRERLSNWTELNWRKTLYMHTIYIINYFIFFNVTWIMN